MSSKDLGGRGESLAVDILRKQGYKILQRNFSCKIGEIDIIALDDNVLIFVEVKTRSNSWYG
ncbi:YraN family protein, partial [Candidatus Shapirobacteria bacterium CG10_big_fil_rev_8_21_14_0_10_38_8]